MGCNSYAEGMHRERGKDFITEFPTEFKISLAVKMRSTFDRWAQIMACWRLKIHPNGTEEVMK